jgi:hypothetical protein
MKASTPYDLCCRAKMLECLSRIEIVICRMYVVLNDSLEECTLI